MKRQLAVLLLTGILANLAACSGDAPAAGDMMTANAEISTAAEEARFADNLPEDLDFGGEVVTFLYREEKVNEFSVEEATGDVVDDALYNSHRSVEERLNVKIETIAREGHLNPARGEYMTHVSTTAMAGDSVYDWVDLMIGNAPVKMVEGIFLDLAQNKYMDLSKPWYLEGMMDKMAIDEKLYFVSGDASLGYLKCAFCLYFNAALVEDYKLGNLYDIVDSGKWTMDKLAEISASASQDVNGDSKYDENDKLGLIVHDNNHPWGFIAALELNTYDKAAKKFTFGTDRDSKVIDAMYNQFFRAEGSWFPDISNGNDNHLEQYNNISKKFVSGDVLIMTAELDDAVMQFRDMKDNYGILPYPKLDENQENYHAGSRSTHNAFSLLITSEDPDRAGAVMEALASSNYATVLPAYFETALKVKYSRDDDSARMFDLIRSVMTLDFGYVYSNAIGAPMSVISSIYKTENSIASNVASNKERLDMELKTYLERLTKLN